MKDSDIYNIPDAYHIIFGVDKNYVKYTAVLMHGIILQAKNHQLMPLGGGGG